MQKLIDNCEENEGKPIGDYLMLEYAKYIYLFRTKLEDYENDLQDLKNEWRKYLIENEHINQLEEDLSKILDRAETESKDYETRF